MSDTRSIGEPLRRALIGARLRDIDVAQSLGVDPKTVQRWLGGRVPHARHRWGVADLLSVHEYDLWPHLAELPSIDPEVYATYPHRGSVPREIWHRLFDHAEHEIGILVYSGLFIAEDAELIRLLAAQGSRRGQPCGSPSATPTAPTSTNAARTRAFTTQWPPRSATPSCSTAHCSPRAWRSDCTPPCSTTPSTAATTRC